MNHKLRGIQTAVPCITTSWPDVWYHEGQRIFSSGSDHSRKRETIFNTINKASIKKDGMSKVRTILSCVYCVIYRVCLLTLCGTSENATDISYLLKLAKISISTNWDGTFIQNPNTTNYTNIMVRTQKSTIRGKSCTRKMAIPIVRRRHYLNSRVRLRVWRPVYLTLTNHALNTRCNVTSLIRHFITPLNCVSKAKWAQNMFSLIPILKCVDRYAVFCWGNIMLRYILLNYCYVFSLPLHTHVS